MDVDIYKSINLLGYKNSFKRWYWSFY